MNQFKRAQVVILPTEQYTNLCLGHNLSYVESKNSISIDAIWKSIKLQYPYKPQHLYIISDDEIKEGDLHITSDHSGFGFRKYKIIATTDTSLKVFIDGNGNKSSHELTKSGYIEFLPQPSQQFIEKYIEYYNKNEIITDVLVEYERDEFKVTGKGLVIQEWLKINPKDNTITIKKLKNSWNREEVINMLFKVAHYCQGDMQSADLLTYQWIEKNL